MDIHTDSHLEHQFFFKSTREIFKNPILRTSNCSKYCRPCSKCSVVLSYPWEEANLEHMPNFRELPKCGEQHVSSTFEVVGKNTWDTKAHRFYCNRTFSPSWWEAHLEHLDLLRFPCCWLLSFSSISFHVLSFPFISFPFMSTCFLSCPFMSFHFPFMSFSFLALISLQVLSCPSCTPCYKWCSYELLP